MRLSVLILSVLLLSNGALAGDKPPIQVVQLLDLVGISTDEADQFLQREIMAAGYQVIPITEKPRDYYVLSILNSNVASRGAIATGLSAVIERYDAKSDQEYLVDHSTTVILISGPDMEMTAPDQGYNALRGIVKRLDTVLKEQP